MKRGTFLRPACALLASAVTAGATLSFGAGPEVRQSNAPKVAPVPPRILYSEASLDFYANAAARLFRADTARELATMAKNLDALRERKKTISDRAQLVAIENAIKDLLGEIEKKKAQEEREQDEAKRAADALSRIERSLSGEPTAMQGPSAWTGFSEARRREARARARRALAHLALLKGSFSKASEPPAPPSSPPPPPATPPPDPASSASSEP